MNKIEEILKKIKITIPNPPKPVGNYAAFSRYEKLIFISGQLPITADGKIITGKGERRIHFFPSIFYLHLFYYTSRS